MVKKAQNKTLKDAAIEAALSLAASKSWDDVSFEEIIEKAGVSLEDAREYFDDKLDILAAYGRKIDRAMTENISNSSDESHRDAIFDVLMERFDFVNEDRAAITSILNSFKHDPKQAVLGLPHLGRSMTRVLEAANISTQGIAGCVRVTGLTGIYLYVLRTWKDDDSPDMGKTMAALDKALDKAEMLYNSLPMS